MTRLCLLAVAFTLALSFASGAAAQPISRNNPYRSFNISGVNYGSQRWEREHRSGGRQYYRGHHTRSHRRFFRRR